MNKTTRKHWAKCTTGGGFTLAELLIVVAVIAVLVAVAIPTFGNQLEKSRQSVDESNLRDAYAAAQLAVLNQDGTKTDLSTNPLAAIADADRHTGLYDFWYDLSTEEMTYVSDSTKTAAETAKGTMGKAKSNTLYAETASLKDVRGKYDAETLSTSLVGKLAGTVDKGLIITFRYDEAKTKFEVYEVTYKEKGSAFRADSQSSTALKFTLANEGTSAPDEVTLVDTVVAPASTAKVISLSYQDKAGTAGTVTLDGTPLVTKNGLQATGITVAADSITIDNTVTAGKYIATFGVKTSAAISSTNYAEKIQVTITVDKAVTLAAGTGSKEILAANKGKSQEFALSDLLTVTLTDGETPPTLTATNTTAEIVAGSVKGLSIEVTSENKLKVTTPSTITANFTVTFTVTNPGYISGTLDVVFTIGS